MVIELTVNWQTFAICFASLVIFGFGYNALIDWLDELHEGFTSWLVAGGVLVTLFVSGFVTGFDNSLILGLLFIASGGPMIAGEARRQWLKRKRAKLEAERKTWPTENE